MPLLIPDKSKSTVAGHQMKRRLLGASVLIIVAVIVLPLVLDGSGTESRFRRVEQVRQEPPVVLDAGQPPPADLRKPIANSAEKPADPAPVVAVEKDIPLSAVAGTDEKPESGSEPDRSEPTTATEATPRAKPPAEEVVTSVQAPNPSPPPAPSPTPLPAPPPTPVPAQTPTAAVAGDPGAWIIQAGSFSTEARAASLRDQLRDAGLPAFFSRASSRGQSVYRVKVGPVSQRERADSVRLEINQAFGLQSIVRPYP